MLQFAGIVKNTMLSIKRSPSFYLLIILLVSASVILPGYLKSTGVPEEDISTAIDYSVSIVSLIVFISAIWTSCIEMNFDLEGHQIHLVFVKPAKRAVVWLGKFSGILIVHILFLLGSFIIIYSVLMFRIYNSSYNDREIFKIEEEVLAGRKTVFPEIPGLREEINSELKKKINTAFEKNESLSEAKIEEIKQNIFINAIIKRGEVKPGSSKIFEYKNIRSEYNNIILEYKVFVGEIDLVDRQVRRSAHIMWALKDNIPNSFINIYGNPEKVLSNDEYRKDLPALPVKDNTVTLKFENLSPDEPIFFQLTESPVIKVKYTGFLVNYFRGLIIISLGLCLVTGLGCALGGLFSFPIAAFSIISYLIIGFVSGMIYSNAVELNQNLSFQTKIGYMINDIIQKLIPTIQTFQPSELLSNGRLIEWSYIFLLVKNNLLLHGLFIFAAGIFLYSIREVGLINRK